MKFCLCENYDEMSLKAAELVANEVKNNPTCTLGLATGSTPIGTYRELCRRYDAGELDFSKVTSYNLDEYYPLAQDNSQSYYTFMQENLFSKINIPKDAVHIPNGEAPDADAECRRYEEELLAHGGVDLQILGIGENGHIGFNEPDAALYADTHLTGLTESTIRANSRFFASEDEVPRHALTMGMGTIMRAKKILLLISGAAKRKALAALRDGMITTSVPATLLKAHPDVTILFDKAACEE